MRAIDADEFSKKWEGKIYEGDVRTLLVTAPTIEPRCETCEAFNKTRLLIPQPERKKGWWIEHNPHKWGLGIVFECSECGEKIDCEPSNFCPNCGAEMEGQDEKISD